MYLLSSKHCNLLSIVQIQTRNIIAISFGAKTYFENPFQYREHIMAQQRTKASNGIGLIVFNYEYIMEVDVERRHCPKLKLYKTWFSQLNHRFEFKC